MRTTFGKSSQTFRGDVASRGQLVVASVLLVGVVVLGYGYFRQNKIGFYVGLAVILAGVLNGVVQILSRGKK